MGEFWVGRRGENRLPNGYEFSGREEYHIEGARIFREKLLEMRYYGISGLIPFRFHHNVVEISSLKSKSDMKKPFYRWKFLHLRNLAGRGLAPVVRFVCPRSVSLAEEIRFEREIVVYNDFEDPVNLTVNCTYGRQTNSWPVTLEPAGQKKIKVGFIPEPDAAEIVVTVHHRSVNYLEGDQLPILVISPGEA